MRRVEICDRCLGRCWLGGRGGEWKVFRGGGWVKGKVFDANCDGVARGSVRELRSDIKALC